MHHHIKHALCLVLGTFIFIGSYASLCSATSYSGDNLGYLDNIMVNDRHFETFMGRSIELYNEDLQDGHVVIRGILESESDEVAVTELAVEVSTDGGTSWQRATGNKSWNYQFEAVLNQPYQLSFRVVQLLSREARQQQLRDRLAPKYRSNLHVVIDRLVSIIDSEEFIKGDVARFQRDLDKIIIDLAEAGINIGRGKGRISNMPGGSGEIENLPDNTKTAEDFDTGGFFELVDALQDQDAHYGLVHSTANDDAAGAGGGGDPMAGRFGQEAVDWTATCQSVIDNGATGNGDLNVDGTDLKNGVVDECIQKLKGTGYELSKREERLMKTTPGTMPGGVKQMPSGRGGSEDPADGGTNPVRLTEQQKAAIAKQLKDRDPLSPQGKEGASGGGEDDERGDTGDDQDEEGMMQYQPDLAGGTDDPRLDQNSGSGRGEIRTINRVQTGGGTGAGEHM